MIKRLVFVIASLGCVSFISLGCFGDDPLEIDFHENEKKASSVISDTDENDAGIDSACNPDWEPTWDDPINDIMQSQCTSCHPETATYESIQGWVNDGQLKTYCEKGATHYLLSGQEYCLRWLEIGTPKSDCDVAAKK